eukprot:maker-scaffold_2-snap-gene-5.66-mRNA-1 protein AED:0.00 eAED:0.00 QI:151/1/1/1/1/1/2/100/78
MGIHDMTAKQAWTKYGTAVFGASFISYALIRGYGTTPSTMTREWKQASEKYRKHQNMDPIGIGGRKYYEPSYMKKEEK